MNVLWLVCDLQIPLIMLIVSVIMKRFPPRFRSGFGYRTSFAEKNELTWNTAQWLFARYCVVFMIIAAVIGAAAGIICIIKSFDEDASGGVCTSVNMVQAVLLFVAIILTEVGLHKRFDRNGNPK